MGRYVNVVAKKGCIGQINELFARSFPGEFLVYDRARVEKEVEWCQTEGPAHLRYITTPELWNESFTIYAEGRGQIFIESERTKKQTAELKAMVEWVIANRLLFDEVTGLQDADDLGVVLEPKVTGYAKGMKVIDNSPVFEKLPVEADNAVYQLAKRHDRADLWAAYRNFRECSNLDTWRALRCKVVPGGKAMLTVWQRVEALEFERTGIDAGLVGKYADSRPSYVMAEFAILVSEHSVLAIRESQRPLLKKK